MPFAALDPVLAPVPVRQERSDDYPCIAQLNDRWRVIRCADDMQWILQRRKGVLWFGNSYHRDARSAASANRPDGAVRFPTAALDLIGALPERFQEGAQ